MLVVKHSDFGTIPIEHHRTQGRLNSRVCVAIEWEDRGQQFHTEGSTSNVSREGCLVVVTLELGVGQRARLTNLTNQNLCEAILVWRKNQGQEGWELGFELQESGFDFWDLEF